MSTVGIFAGRGDVIVAMGLSIVVGIWIGWQAKSLYTFFKARFNKTK